MSNEVIFKTAEDFIKEVKSAGISKIAFSETNERRAENTKDDLLEVVTVRKVDVLAYLAPTIYKYSEETEDLDSLCELFQSNGLNVTRINKNIT